MAAPHQIVSSFSAPIPGQSLTHAPKSMPYEKPPQFTTLKDAMNMLLNQLTEPQHLKQLLALMDAGMPIEAICRTLLFTGFAHGKWTPDLAMLMYKPLMLLLITMAHKAGKKDTPVVMHQSLQKYIMNNMRNRAAIVKKDGGMIGMPKNISKLQENPIDEETILANKGFMTRGAA